MGPLFNLTTMASALALNLGVVLLVVYRVQGLGYLEQIRRSTLILFNLLIYVFCSVLIHMDISIGAGVGLFAVLAMLRFRSEVLKMEELIYLLLLIGLGFIHASMPSVLDVAQVLLIDVVLIVFTFGQSTGKESSLRIKVRIDNLDLLRPGNQDYLQEILETRTGHALKSIRVVCVNLKDGEANLMVELTKPGHSSRTNVKASQNGSSSPEANGHSLSQIYIEN